MLILIFEGLLIGCLLGLTGAGGGILAVPALIASQGWTVAQAAPVGLLAVTLAAFVGVIEGLIKKNVRYKAGLWIALISIPFAKYGVYLANIIPSVWLNLAFSLVMFFIAYCIFYNKQSELDNVPCRINEQTGRFIWNFKTVLILGGIGIIAGLLTGTLGVGGGFVIVPALCKATNLKMKSIVATSLMVIFLIGSISILINLLNGFQYPFNISITFVLSCILGLLFGRVIINLISAKTVQSIFASTIIVVACYMLYLSIF